MRPFVGIYVPLLTFFDAQGEVDLEAQRRHVARLVQAGVHGVVPMATMGEFAALDREERRTIAEAVLQEVQGRAKVVVGASAPSTREAVALARDAEALGADGVMALTPFFIRPSAEAIRRHYEALRKAVDLPLIAYNLPGFTGVEIPVDLVHELAREGTIQGIKDSSGDLARALWTLAELPEDFSFLTGADPLLTAVLLHGGQGGMVGSANVVPEKAVRLYRLVQEHRLEEARGLQFQLASFSRALRVGTFPAAAKYLVERVSGLRGHGRLPVVELTKEEKRQVDEIAKSLLEK